MDSTEVRETSMVIGDSHARRRSSNLKPHLTESDVRLNIAQQASNPRQNSLSTVSEGSECAGFRYHADDAVIVEVRFGGTHRGVWAGIAPTGNRMEVQSVCIFVFEGDDSVCEKVYFDHATILRQLGAVP